MKKILYVFLTVILVSTFSSCDLETVDNGKLDGFWHLERVDTLLTGGHRDLSNAKLFWSFEIRLMALQGGSAPFLYRFHQTGDSLIIYSPYTNDGHEEGNGVGGNKPVKDSSLLKDYGIEDLEVRYEKETLSGSRMVLRSHRLRLYFRKF